MEEITVNEGLNYVHLISGGLDSTYSLMDLTRSIMKEEKLRSVIYPIFFDYGQFAAVDEYSCAKKVVSKVIAEYNAGTILYMPKHISLRSDLFGWCRNVAFTGTEVGDATCEIQNRNMVLFSVLASYLFACAENQKISKSKFEVYSGFKEREMPDCNSEFFGKLSQLLSLYKPNFEIAIILLPDFKRQQVVNKMKKLLKGSEVKLKQFKAATISCYSPQNGKACGLCWKCKQLNKETLR